jgi:hypothetical protein
VVNAEGSLHRVEDLDVEVGLRCDGVRIRCTRDDMSPKTVDSLQVCTNRPCRWTVGQRIGGEQVCDGNDLDSKDAFERAAK